MSSPRMPYPVSNLRHINKATAIVGCAAWRGGSGLCITSLNSHFDWKLLWHNMLRVFKTEELEDVELLSPTCGDAESGQDVMRRLLPDIDFIIQGFHLVQNGSLLSLFREQ